MTDDLKTAPMPGVVRTAAQTTRAKNQELEAELAECRRQLEATRLEATALAQYLKSRVNITVWDHADVMQILQDSAVGICASVLAKVREAEQRGLPASYAGFREILITRFEESRAEVLDRVGHPEERGATNSPDLVSDRMKHDLRNVLRLPNAA